MTQQYSRRMQSRVQRRANTLHKLHVEYRDLRTRYRNTVFLNNLERARFQVLLYDTQQEVIKLSAVQTLEKRTIRQTVQRWRNRADNRMRNEMRVKRQQARTRKRVIDGKPIGAEQRVLTIEQYESLVPA